MIFLFHEFMRHPAFCAPLRLYPLQHAKGQKSYEGLEEGEESHEDHEENEDQDLQGAADAQTSVES
jgi:hypothetical protein